MEGGVGVFQMTNCEDGQVIGKGFACHFRNSFPPASEREARMDDPTRRCENDTRN